jgi:hypothetical protein
MLFLFRTIEHLREVTAASGSKPRRLESTQEMPRDAAMARLTERIRKVE